MRLTPRQPQILEALRQHVATGLVEPLDRQNRSA
jgi:hypothetical protein